MGNGIADIAKALIDAEQILDNQVPESYEKAKEVIQQLYYGNKLLMGTLEKRQTENGQVISDMMSVVLAAEAFNDAANKYSSDLKGLGREAKLRHELGKAIQKFRESETYAMMHKAPPSKMAERLDVLERAVAGILLAFQSAGSLPTSGYAELYKAVVTGTPVTFVIEKDDRDKVSVRAVPRQTL